MSKLVYLMLLVFTLSALPAGYAQDESSKLKVLVEALGDQKDQVKKYVTVALDILGDVEIVEDGPDVYIHIITRKLVTNKGNSLGFVMTSASSEILEMNFDGGKPFIVSDYSGLWLEVGPDLFKLCDQCIKAINASVFERMREGKAIEG
jgi:hypothetical protein